MPPHWPAASLRAALLALLPLPWTTVALIIGVLLACFGLAWWLESHF